MLHRRISDNRRKPLTVKHEVHSSSCGLLLRNRFIRIMLLALGLKGEKPNLKAKLNVKRRDGLLLAVFYAVVGIAQLVILALSNFELYPYGVLAVLSFIAAYGFFTVKKWSVWLLNWLFFSQIFFWSCNLFS